MSGRSGWTTSRLGHRRRRRKGDNEGSHRLILGRRQVLKRGENALCCSTSKSHLILDTFVPFPPSASPILTHHLNKEVRAMIKSSHSVKSSCSPNVGPNLCRFRDPPLRQTSETHPFSLLLHHRGSLSTAPGSSGAKSARFTSTPVASTILPHPPLVTSSISPAAQVDGT